MAREAELAKGVPGFYPNSTVSESESETEIVTGVETEIGIETATEGTVDIDSNLVTQHHNIATTPGNTDSSTDSSTNTTTDIKTGTRTDISTDINSNSNTNMISIIHDPLVKSDQGPVVVIIRHGKTEYNKIGLFSGKNVSYVPAFYIKNISCIALCP